MKALLLVFVGGGIGSALRYLIGKTLNDPDINGFPWGTFLVNLLGSLIIGLLFGWALQKSKLPTDTLLLVAVGFCGGFTTFSAFAFEGMTLLKNGQLGIFFTYAAGSIVAGLLCVWIGYLAVRSMT